jgi:hypothetical protein
MNNKFRRRRRRRRRIHNSLVGTQGKNRNSRSPLLILNSRTRTREQIQKEGRERLNLTHTDALTQIQEKRTRENKFRRKEERDSVLTHTDALAHNKF